MQEKNMSKHDGGHQEMNMEAMRKVNEPHAKEKAMHMIVSHQEHEEGHHVHNLHHFSTEAEHNKD